MGTDNRRIITRCLFGNDEEQHNMVQHDLQLTISLNAVKLISRSPLILPSRIDIGTFTAGNENNVVFKFASRYKENVKVIDSARFCFVFHYRCACQTVESNRKRAVYSQVTISSAFFSSFLFRPSNGLTISVYQP